MESTEVIPINGGGGVPAGMRVRVWTNMGWRLHDEQVCTPTITPGWPALGTALVPIFLDDPVFGVDLAVYHDGAAPALRRSCAWVTGTVRPAGWDEAAAFVAAHRPFKMVWGLSEMPPCGGPFTCEGRLIRRVRRVLLVAARDTLLGGSYADADTLDGNGSEGVL